MFRVIETRVKTPQSGKALEARRRVADRADRIRVVGKLLLMTARARNVSGKFRCRRIVGALVTNQTRQTAVRRVRVPEFRKIRLRLRRRRQKIPEKGAAAEKRGKQPKAPRQNCGCNFLLFAFSEFHNLLSGGFNRLPVRFGNR